MLFSYFLVVILVLLCLFVVYKALFHWNYVICYYVIMHTIYDVDVISCLAYVSQTQR